MDFGSKIVTVFVAVIIGFVLLFAVEYVAKKHTETAANAKYTNNLRPMRSLMRTDDAGAISEGLPPIVNLRQNDDAKAATVSSVDFLAMDPLLLGEAAYNILEDEDRYTPHELSADGRSTVYAEKVITKIKTTLKKSTITKATPPKDWTISLVDSHYGTAIERHDGINTHHDHQNGVKIILPSGRKIYLMEEGCFVAPPTK